MASRKFLIVTADDFGLHESVNVAVEQASREGLLTAASLMVAAPSAADAVRRAKTIPHLRVGLHLVLADGKSALGPDLAPLLVDDQGWMDGRMFVRGVKYFALAGVRRQLEAEIREQFAAFARTGLELDHVNVHKHFHMHPSVLEMLLRIGRDFGVSAVRLPKEPFWFAAHSRARLSRLHTGLFAPGVAFMKRRLGAADMFHNDQLFGIAASGAMDEAKLMAILERLPPGVTEIYLHPATMSGAKIAESMSGYGHSGELAALLSPRVLACAAALDIVRGGFRDAQSARLAA